MNSRKNDIDALLDAVDEGDDDQVQADFSDGWDDSDNGDDENNENTGMAALTDGKIIYHNHACVKNGSEMKFISHEAITPAIVAAGFYELVGSHIQASDKVYSQSHIRLFFDIDIKNDDGVMDLYNEILNFADKLKPLFGDASISGYTNSRAISKETKCRWNMNVSKSL